MQKKIGYINVDSQRIQWMLDNLPEDELKDAFRRLAGGEYSAVMIESASDTELAKSNYIIKCGELEINEKARIVKQGDAEISLTPKEFDILLFLARNRGEVFTKEQIYKAVWDGEYVMDDSNIMAFIRKLRKKIEPNPDDPKYILTIWGIGYKFNDKI